MVSTTGLFHLALPPYIASSQERARDRCRTQDLCFLCFRCLCRSSFPNNRSVTSKTKPPERAWLRRTKCRRRHSIGFGSKRKSSHQALSHRLQGEQALARDTSRRRSDSRTV